MPAKSWHATINSATPPRKFKPREDLAFTVVLTFLAVAILLALFYGVTIIINAAGSNHHVSADVKFADTLVAPSACHQTKRAEDVEPGDATTSATDVLTVTYACNNVLGSTLYAELTGLIKAAGYQINQDYSTSPNQGMYSYSLGFDNGKIGGVYAVTDSLSPDQTTLQQKRYSGITLSISPLNTNK